jgi:uncharacterized membrane protein
VHGFLYSGGSWTTLDNPAATASGHPTVASGINDSGQIVGHYADASWNAHGVLYSGGSYTNFDDPSATNNTIATGINATGQIVGQYTDASSLWQSFLFGGDSSNLTLNAPAVTPIAVTPIPAVGLPDMAIALAVLIVWTRRRSQRATGHEVGVSLGTSGHD